VVLSGHENPNPSGTLQESTEAGPPVEAQLASGRLCLRPKWGWWLVAGAGWREILR
jgi:hypothetical protein